MEKKESLLFTPLQMGALTLPNRVCMAAMTRTRCDPLIGVPTELHVDYYSQRAEAGFILTECTQIVPEGTSFPGSCGIHSEEQVEGWKKVTDAVHKKGGRIILQIWHGGRAVHVDHHEGGKQPISSSDLPIRENARTKNGKVPNSVPKPMDDGDFKYIIEAFRKGAENAKRAGFDGIELHGANGYLIDQFLRDSVNKRTDKYGGSIENRCRFPLEVIDQLIAVFGADRVGVKLSPSSRYQDMSDSDPIALYSYLLEELSNRKIAFVEVVEAGEMFAGPSKEFHPDPFSQFKGTLAENLRSKFKGVYIANNNFDLQKANDILEKGLADAVTFARFFIGNPDLVSRFKNSWPLEEFFIQYVYTGGEKGYSDYRNYKP